MRNLRALAGLFLTASALAFAQNPSTCGTQTIPICTAPAPAGEVQIKPQAVPTSPTVVTNQDAYPKTVVVSNPTGGAITFTLADRQTSPVSLLPAVSIAANSTVVVVFPAGYWCPGGFTVAGSDVGLTWYGSWRQ